MRSRTIASIVGGACLLGVAALACPPGTMLWIKQFGTPRLDYAGYALATDAAGNVYTGGATEGNLSATNSGGQDAWIGKFGPGGGRKWIRQFGMPAWDYVSSGVVLDAEGNAFVAGQTRGGSLFGPFAGGLNDSWLAKYSPQGDLLWGIQFGTPGEDSVSAIATDSDGNVIVGGHTQGALFGPHNNGWLDAFVAKYDRNGNLVWGHQFGAGGGNWDDSHAIAVDQDDNIVAAGHTKGSLFAPYQGGDSDGFIVKYAPDGTRLWARQFGTPAAELFYDIAVDSTGAIYGAGHTDGSFAGPSQGGPDAFVIKYNADATRKIWSKQVGTPADDRLHRGLSVDLHGNVILAGQTSGSLGGPNQGGRDGWIVKLSSVGTQRWARQLGTAADDELDGVVTDNKGNIFVSGWTRGSLGGSNRGGGDAWIAKFMP